MTRTDFQQVEDLEFSSKVCLFQAGCLKIAPVLLSECDKCSDARPEDWYVLGLLVQAIECGAWSRLVLSLFDRLQGFRENAEFCELLAARRVIKKHQDDSKDSLVCFGNAP